VKKGVKLYTTYEPTDLIDLNIEKLLYTNAPGIKLRSEAADALAIMLKNLKSETGKDVVIASGYRSYNVQFRTYVEWVRQLGLEEADTLSARAGYSEHQLGTAVDFMSQDSGFDFTEAFDATVAGQWLVANAHNYGFVLSYPKDMVSETGYAYEPWHYRYIGLDLAAEYKESGMVLNKFLSGK
jgi:D-alanyl-D-alanine carboxypeptidase